MTEQPRALRLAEIIGGDCAAELRRLHEEVTEQGRLLSMSAERELALLARIDRLEKLNAELLEAMEELLACPAGDYDTTDDYENAVKRANAAIAKATGEQA